MSITRAQIQNELRKNVKDKKLKKKDHKSKLDEFLLAQNASDLDKNQIANDLESYSEYRNLEE